MAVICRFYTFRRTGSGWLTSEAQACAVHWPDPSGFRQRMDHEGGGAVPPQGVQALANATLRKG